MPLKQLLTLFFGIIFFSFTTKTIAQEVVWATKVMGYSSQFLGKNQTLENSNIQVLGAPNKLPGIGKSVCAWQPAKEDNPIDEYIKVAFDTLMNVKQVIIAENFGQGCLKEILGYDSKNQEYLIYQEKRLPDSKVGKLNTIILKESTHYLLKYLKIVINTNKVKGINQIDAIGISASEKSIVAKINIAENTTNLKYIKENLGAGVNSATTEVAPVISPDGKLLYFTRTKHPENMGINKDQDVWFSKNINGNWSAAENMPKPINNIYNNAVCAISNDSKRLFLINEYLSDSTMRQGISYSTLGKKGWAFPLAMKIRNYYNYIDGTLDISPWSEFTVSGDGKVLLMPLKRRDSVGSRDIYVSFWEGNGQWSEPKHTGNIVNTAENEMAPFLASDNKTMYYSSKGYPGYGDNDIFITRRLDDTWTKWTTPVNMGEGINTNDWDGYFSLPSSGEYAYLVSRNQSLGNEDIFRIKVAEANKPNPVVMLSGTIVDDKNEKLINSKLNFIATKNPKDTIKVDFKIENGTYKVILPLNEKYQVLVTAEGYMTYFEEIKFPKNDKYIEKTLNYRLGRIKSGVKTKFNELVFEQGSYELKATSYNELDQIAEMMKENPFVTIHLDGHTDFVGDVAQNMILSQNRVEEVKNYMVKKGVTAKKITTKAWGGTKPLIKESSEKNRRVEFTINKN